MEFSCRPESSTRSHHSTGLPSNQERTQADNCNDLLAFPRLLAGPLQHFLE